MKLPALTTAIFILILLTGCENKHYTKGKELLEQNLYSDARHEFEVVLNEEPDHISAMYGMSLAYYMEKEVYQALFWRAKLLALDAQNNDAKKLATLIINDCKKYLKDSSSDNILLGLDYTAALLSEGLIDKEPILTDVVKPLLSHNDDYIMHAAYNVLAHNGMEKEGLWFLLENNNWEKVYTEVKGAPLDEDGEKMLREVFELCPSSEREDIAKELIREYNWNYAKSVLAQIYHKDLQSKISNYGGLGFQLDKRIKEIAKVAYTLDDPTLAGDLAELICSGAIYGFLATDVTDGIKRFNKSAVPSLNAVLEKENEYINNLKGKGWGKSQIYWRFDYIRRCVAYINKKKY